MIKECREEVYRYGEQLQTEQASLHHERMKVFYVNKQATKLYEENTALKLQIERLAGDIRTMQREIENAQTNALAQEALTQECERMIRGGLTEEHKAGYELRIAALEKDNVALNDTLAVAMNVILNPEEVPQEVSMLAEEWQEVEAQDSQRHEVVPKEDWVPDREASVGSRREAVVLKHEGDGPSATEDSRVRGDTPQPRQRRGRGCRAKRKHT